MLFCHLMTFFKINIFKKFFHEHYQSVKQFGSRSGLTFCRPWSGSKRFAKLISRRQKSQQARKELNLRCTSNLISVCIMVKYIRLQQQESITVTAEICLEIDNCKTALSLLWKWIKDRVALLFEYKTKFFPFKIMPCCQYFLSWKKSAYCNQMNSRIL